MGFSDLSQKWQLWNNISPYIFSVEEDLPATQREQKTRSLLSALSISLVPFNLLKWGSAVHDSDLK